MASSLGSAALVKRCHVCGEPATIEPSAEAALDAPCPCCGNLIGPHPPAATRIRLSAFPILDQQTMQVFTRLDHWLDEAQPREVRLDFANVKFLSSAALGKMVTLAKKAKSLSVRLVLCNIDPMIQEVLAITNLKKLFEIE